MYGMMMTVLRDGRVVPMDSPEARADLIARNGGYPVECCRCRRIYDLHKVKVVGRFTDCTEWIAPCCGARVNDGPFNRDYRKL